MRRLWKAIKMCCSIANTLPLVANMIQWEIVIEEERWYKKKHMKNSGTKMNKWMYFQNEKNRRITLSSAIFLRYASNAVVSAPMNWSFNRFICCENDIKTLAVSVLIGFCCSSVDKNQFMTIYLLIIICRHFVAIFFFHSQQQIPNRII